jgi:hypothetical protein
VDNQPVTAEGSAFIEAHVRVPGSNELVPFFTPDMSFVEAIVTETVDDISTWEITVQSSSRNFVDNLLKNASAGATPRIRVRLGIGSLTGEMLWQPWQELIVRQPVSKIEGLGNSAGYYTTVIASNLLWEINRINRVIARKGIVSKIVQDIADFYGLPSVIEPTKYEGMWFQSYISDFEFVKWRMLYRALNDKGRGNYKFFMKDNVLHFHTIDYQTELKTFGYETSSGISLILTDASQESLVDGSGGYRYVSHDPYSGIMKEFLEDRSKVLLLGNESPRNYNIKGVQKNVMFHVGSNSSPEVLALATSRYEDAKSSAFRAELIMPKSLFFHAGDIVNLIVNPSKGQTTPTSGYYYVPKLVHRLNKTSIVTAVTFERGEWQGAVSSQSSLTQSGENILTPQNSIQGQSINVNAVQSSQVTKGAGNEASRNRFLDAHNPNTALS